MADDVLAGGFRRGDRVASLSAKPSVGVAEGDVGTVVGPCNNSSAGLYEPVAYAPSPAEPSAGRICVKFDSGTVVGNNSSTGLYEPVAYAPSPAEPSGDRICVQFDSGEQLSYLPGGIKLVDVPTLTTPSVSNSLAIASVGVVFTSAMVATWPYPLVLPRVLFKSATHVVEGVRPRTWVPALVILGSIASRLTARMAAWLKVSEAHDDLRASGDARCAAALEPGSADNPSQSQFAGSLDDAVSHLRAVLRRVQTGPEPSEGVVSSREGMGSAMAPLLTAAASNRLTTIGEFLEEKVLNMKLWLLQEGYQNSIDVGVYSSLQLTAMAQKLRSEHLDAITSRDFEALLAPMDLPAGMLAIVVFVRNREKLHDKFWRYLALFSDTVA